jgi:hypothetical protein
MMSLPVSRRDQWMRGAQSCEEPMLGAVKGDEDAENVPLFRVLARRWKSFAPVKRGRVTLSSVQSADEQPAQRRAWISKPRPPIYAHHKIEKPKSARGWNPWLWMK